MPEPEVLRSNDQPLSIFNDSMKGQLHSELADATILVWKMQNGLAAGDATLAELEAYSNQLHQRAACITGLLARWSLFVKGEIV